ncbi:MAG: electron transport complex subunit RsxC [Paludibacteraceae bacterium]|nr:electron transport complex subunit RsxC [Paludibacteraceae bacterium]
MKTFSLGGIHPHDNKLSARKPFKVVALPDVAIFPLEQHIGAPAKPIVAVGDKVLAGQMIAEAGGFVSAPVHSSVSGTVQKIATFTDGWGFDKMAIHIKVEGSEWVENIQANSELRTECNLSSEEIIKKIADAGIVGLGGACFPTQVKLMPPKDMSVDTLIINAVECEPYLTHNHQLMLEKPAEVLMGVRILMQALNIKKAIIGIEANKMDAVELLKGELIKEKGECQHKVSAKNTSVTESVDVLLTDREKVPEVNVVPLKLKYPQGGEKQLIEALTGRKVPNGGIPAAVGCVVQNVGTAFAVYEAVQLNKPLVEVMMTVTGPSVTNPGNFIVRIGTPIEKVLEMAGGIPADTGKIIGGGPMMGKTYSHTNHPVSKRSSGLLLLPNDMAAPLEEKNCIRCGKCVQNCPMGLAPYLLATQGEMALWDDMEQEQVANCIECGCCTFTCPSNRPLLDYIRYGKQTVMANIRARASK